MDVGWHAVWAVTVLSLYSARTLCYLQGAYSVHSVLSGPRPVHAVTLVMCKHEVGRPRLWNLISKCVFMRQSLGELEQYLPQCIIPLMCEKLEKYVHELRGDLFGAGALSYFVKKKSDQRTFLGRTKRSKGEVWRKAQRKYMYGGLKRIRGAGEAAKPSINLDFS